MTEKEENELIERMHRGTLDYWENQRKNAFPTPPQKIDDDPERAAAEDPKKTEK